MPLTPVVSGRTVPTFPRTVVIAVVVGVLAFVAGLQFDLGRTLQVALVSPGPTASPAPTDQPTPAGPPPVSLEPISGPAAVTFEPGPIITATPGGKTCRIDATAGPEVQSLVSGQIQVRTWLALCPLKAATQPAFRDLLFQEFANAVGASSGWSTTADGSGLSTADIPFVDGDGLLTLVVATHPVGDTLVIAITLAPTTTYTESGQRSPELVVLGAAARNLVGDRARGWSLARPASRALDPGAGENAASRWRSLDFERRGRSRSRLRSCRVRGDRRAAGARTRGGARVVPRRANPRASRPQGGSRLIAGRVSAPPPRQGRRHGGTAGPSRSSPGFTHLRRAGSCGEPEDRQAQATGRTGFVRARIIAPVTVIPPWRHSLIERMVQNGPQGTPHQPAMAERRIHSQPRVFSPGAR